MAVVGTEFFFLSWRFGVTKERKIIFDKKRLSITIWRTEIEEVRYKKYIVGE